MHRQREGREIRLTQSFEIGILARQIEATHLPPSLRKRGRRARKRQRLMAEFVGGE
jgi:hypothetical protein